MSLPQLIFVFKCEWSDLYALTLQKDGSNLPRDECKHGWNFQKTLSVSQENIGSLAVDVDQMLADFQTHGFHISRHTAQILPFRKR